MSESTSKAPDPSATAPAREGDSSAKHRRPHRATRAPAAKGNGATPAALPVIPRGNYALREVKQNTWSVTLPADIGRSDLEAPAILAAAPEGVEILDLVWLVANDGSFVAEGIVTESAKVGARIKVLRLIGLQERGLHVPSELPPGHVIRRGNAEQGLVVERIGLDGVRHIMATSAQHPEWRNERNEYDAARTWLRQHTSVLKP